MLQGVQKTELFIFYISILYYSIFTGLLCQEQRQGGPFISWNINVS